jgi:arabinogalactan oligomer/maltooligosaccharide transport system permease protein
VRQGKTPRLRLRFSAGVLLGAALAAWLAHGFTNDARRRVAAEASERKAIVALQALSALIGRAGGGGDAARKVVAAWQAGTPGIAVVRLVRGLQLEASTKREDAGELAAPRRLQREEKPLYDQGQRLASAVQTNRDEQVSRKEEIEVERLPGPRLALALPLFAGGADSSVAGMLAVETVELAGAPQTGWGTFLIALLVTVLAFGALAVLIGEKRVPLALAAALCLCFSLYVVLRQSVSALAADRMHETAAVQARVKEQAALAQSISAAQALSAPAAVAAADWDTDVFRKPRAELGSEGAVDAARLAAAVAATAAELRRALLAADALALALLLLGGLGAFNALGETLKKHRQAYLYIAPAIVGMLVLVFYPFSYGITLSFTDQNLYNTNQSIFDIWVGLRNYRDILGAASFIQRGESSGFSINYLNFYWTLIFTIVWTVTNVAFGVTSGLFLALILNTRALALRPLYRVLLILPWAMPNYITALIWKGMFHQQFGVINQVLQMAGLPAVNWFDRPLTSFFTALATNAWLSSPFMMVVSLGALQSIPSDLYEAATVDGASRWQAFKAITLPSLRPALVPALILSVVWTFNMFNIIYLVTGGEPGGATEILVTQAYKFAFEKYRYGYAAAYSTVIFGILLVYGTIQNKLSKATEA